MAESSQAEKKIPETSLPEKKPFVPVKPFIHPNPKFNKFWSTWKWWGAKPAILKHSRSR